MLGDCIYCDEPLTSELKSLSCKSCGNGYHIVCAEEGRGRYVFNIEEKSHLLRSTKYEINCPECGNKWTSKLDPRE